MSTQDRHRRVMDLFDEACELPTVDRSAFLDRACPDAQLRLEVERLLRFDEQPMNFVEEAARGAGVELLARDMRAEANALEGLAGTDELDDAAAGHSFGDYRIIRRLGEGGMGIVYLAEQQHPRRVVALKVIRVGLASAALLRRFEHEAHVLGRLHHPGIAQIYEAGTAQIPSRRLPGESESHPFFAMEYIDGLPITKYVREHRLDTRRRLQLMVKVCLAVQHAHQKGVIHRDLKPANILVVAESDHSTHGTSGIRASATAESVGQPKILDFGVARLTDDDVRATTIRTDVGQLIGTLQYMSPEQVAADPNELDTRSDVYSLGVVLYELLAGQPPHDLKNRLVPDAVRIIREEEPSRLSSISRGFRGDIETIVGKALEKDKNRRYQSAAELAEDIRRHLNDEILIARPPSVGYQFRKFAKRNQKLVGGIAAVFLMLVLGLVGTSWGLYQAELANVQFKKQRDAAIDAKIVAEDAKAAESLQKQLLVREKLLLERQVRTTQSVLDYMSNDLLAQASPRLQPKRDISLREVLDRASSTIDTRFEDEPLIEAYVRTMLGATYESLGELEESEQHLAEALRLRQSFDGEVDEQVVNSMVLLAHTRGRMGRYPEALAMAEQALEISSRSLGRKEDATLRALSAKGMLLQQLGRFDEALAALREVHAERSAKIGPGHRFSIDTMNAIIQIYREKGELETAETLARELVQICRMTNGSRDMRTIGSTEILTSVLCEQRKFSEALPMAEQNLNAAIEFLAPDHIERMHASGTLAFIHAQTGNLPEAERILRAAVETAQASRGMDNPETLDMTAALAGCLIRMNRLDEAQEILLQVLELQARLHGEEHPVVLSTRDKLANIHADQGRHDQAEALLLQNLEIARRTLADNHPMLLHTLGNMGAVQFEMHKFTEAEAAHAEQIRLWRQYYPSDAVELGVALAQHAQCIAMLKQFKEAEQEFLDAYGIISAAVGKEDARCTHVVELLAAFYGALGPPEKAAEWSAKASAQP